MIIIPLNTGYVCYGTSAETKPAIANGSQYFETDTGRIFARSGAAWVQVGFTGNNTGDVSLSGTPNYITIIGQVITRGLVSLTTHVTGLLPIANGGGLSGVYTPTLTVVANLDGTPGAFEAQYLRVGNVVNVSGKVTVNPTAPAALTQLGISLPIGSNIGAAEDCAGVAFASGIAGQGAAILGDLTNDRAQLEFISGDVTDQPMYYTFQYIII